MTFQSILFQRAEDGARAETAAEPAFFKDLNLDQVVEALVAGKQEYNLRPFFYTTLHHIEAIRYRQEVMSDLEGRTLYRCITSFAEAMHAMRQHLAQAGKLHYKRQQQRWFVDAVRLYCEAVKTLVDDLREIDVQSQGFRDFHAYLAEYVQSARFTSLVAETEHVIADLATVRYNLLIKGNTIKVLKYESEIDYSADVEATFAKFKQGAAKNYLAQFPKGPDMNHVEAQVLDCVAQLYPDVFDSLDSYCTRNSEYLDPTIGLFDREVQFFVAYLEYAASFRAAGLKFCYPQLSAQSKDVLGKEVFDVALAHKLIRERLPVVCNDFHLTDSERIMVVSGPNQGGKTTFARTFGQLHYLAGLGGLVPGREAQLFLYDRLFTHFEREEDIASLHGKLEDDLVRIHDILSEATPSSIIIMNEIFTSTTLQDAIFLGKQALEKVMELDMLCVCVTFIDELATLSEKTVSMVSTVVPNNPTLRTYKIVRKPADGLSYAISIAEKYQLTYDCLQERIAT
jgi:DNA mismatch repair protein MutS